MPVSTTLASQELLRPSPKSHSPCEVFSADEGGVSVPQGILTATFSAGPAHGPPVTPSGHWEKGQARKRQLPLHQGLWTDSDSMVSDGQGGEQGFGFWPEFIYPMVTSPLLLPALSPYGWLISISATTLGLAY
jgi:hypothetical protein